MNIGFYENIDVNFEEALKLSQGDFTHEELLEFLKSGNIPQKQIAALKIEYLQDANDALYLVSNLTGCDGKIREAVALKINQLLHKERQYLLYFTQAEIFANASIDINANICRLVIDSAELLVKEDKFREVYSKKILSFIREAFEALDNFIFRDKKYVINKQLFKLYWSLEAMKLFVETLDEELLYGIYTRAMQEKEYTIREKVAQLILLTPQNEKMSALKEQLKQDENYYVRNVFD